MARSIESIKVEIKELEDSIPTLTKDMELNVFKGRIVTARDILIKRDKAILRIKRLRRQVLKKESDQSEL
jgi:hypothetical protein